MSVSEGSGPEGHFHFLLDVSGKSDVGQKRQNNQDSILVNENLKLFAVADGMGGHSGGEVASAMAVRTLEKVFSENKQISIPERLEIAVHMCNKVIYEHSQANSALMGMGTTLTAAALDGRWLHIAQVGDSRCYFFKMGELYQITEDHSQVYELIKAGLLSEQNAHMVHKNVITRSVGYERTVRVDLFTRQVDVGDRYLLCSDGLSGMITNEQIAQVLQNYDIEIATHNLIDLANHHGGEDNVSVVLFEVK
jgi:serine/threonine protein phosphatase PrpC